MAKLDLRMFDDDDLFNEDDANRDPRRQEIDRMLAEASVLPEGPSKFALLEAALRRAETLADDAWADEIRRELVRTASEVGRHRDMLTLMAQRLKYYDDHRDELDNAFLHRYQLFWHYKWLMGRATDFPRITAEQIFAMVDDFGRRCQEFDSSPQPVARVKRDILLSVGRTEEAREAHSLLATLERGSLSDCQACTEAADVRALLAFGDHAGARALARNFIDNLRHCSHQPRGVLSRMMLPLFFAGERALAMSCHHRALRLLKGDANRFASLTSHVKFLVVTCNDHKAQRLLDEALPAALVSQNPDDRLSLLQALQLWLIRAAAQGKRKCKLRTTPRFPVPTNGGFFDVAELTTWVAAEVAEGVAQFDARNGNDHYTREHRKVLELAERTSAFPLRAKTDGENVSADDS